MAGAKNINKLKMLERKLALMNDIEQVGSEEAHAWVCKLIDQTWRGYHKLTHEDMILANIYWKKWG